jgi:hypothetical protein
MNKDPYAWCAKLYDYFLESTTNKVKSFADELFVAEPGMWVCPEVYQKTVLGCGDPDYGCARHLKRFCEARRLNAEEVRDIIQEFTRAVITRDCYILEAEEFRDGMNSKDVG